MEHDGNGWVHCDHGHRHWGRHGAAGLLLADRRGDGEPVILLQHRAAWTANGGTWGIPGGARDSHETTAQGALREASEETGIRAEEVQVGGELVDDHGHWSYTTVLAELLVPVRLIRQEESAELRWVAVSRVTELELHPGFAGTWPILRDRLG
ncbi:MAG TPA: NUDIX domain-containing protein [Microlunatus sp.]|nr:NUDIX domain-containing protein [Microlunatus sp.]